MEKKKKIYQQPASTVTRVELESPICSASSEIEATSPGASTTAQQVNDSFHEDNGLNADAENWKWD